VFGRRAARAISGQRVGHVKGFTPPPTLDEVDVDLTETWETVRATASLSLGIAREPEELAAATRLFERLALMPLSRDADANSLRAASIVGRLMTRAATLRLESRGAHYRNDHPEPDPAWAGVRMRLARN
jgi:aspartate oxidase